MLTIKNSILLLLARIFAVKRHVVVFIQIFIGTTVAILLPIQCVKIAICRPISAYWELSLWPDQLRQKCIDQDKLFRADIVVSMVTDTVILLIPLPMVFSLNLSIWKRARIFLSLTTGGVAAAITIYKGVVVFEEKKSADRTFELGVLSLLTCVDDSSFYLWRHQKTDKSTIFLVLWKSQPVSSAHVYQASAP